MVAGRRGGSFAEEDAAQACLGERAPADSPRLLHGGRRRHDPAHSAHRTAPCAPASPTMRTCWRATRRAWSTWCAHAAASPRLPRACPSGARLCARDLQATRLDPASSQIEAALRDGTTLEGFRRALLLVLLQVRRHRRLPTLHNAAVRAHMPKSMAAPASRARTPPLAAAPAPQDPPPIAPGGLRQAALQPLEDLLASRARDGEAGILFASAFSLLRMLNSGAAVIFGGGAALRKGPRRAQRVDSCARPAPQQLPAGLACGCGAMAGLT